MSTVRGGARSHSRVGRDYPNAVSHRPRSDRLDHLEPYVAEQRRRAGRTWAQIARAAGVSEGDLRKRFGEAYP
jgi:hypothetical protein